MRKPFIAANWKMNKTVEEVKAGIASFLPMVKDISDVDILLAPPFTSLYTAAKLLEGSNVILAAQNIHFEESGAYTGEVSAEMVRSAGSAYVIIGHSERRQYFHETDEIVNRKIKTARKNGLDVIVCIGESLEEREANKTFEVLEKQLAGSLKDLTLEGVTIAYEPIWAIGTGKTASKEQANEAHAHIREWLKHNLLGADDVRIQYGGSVKPDNIEALMSQPDIDGALVGGASLKPDSFAKIVAGASGK